MKNRKFIFFLLLVTLINLSAALTLVYQNRINRRGSSDLRESRFETVKRTLALTPEQIRRFEIIREQYHIRLDSLNERMEEMRGELLRALWQPEPDQIRMDSIMIRISEIQSISRNQVIDHFNRFRDVLSEKQWEQFYSIVSGRDSLGRACGMPQKRNRIP